MVLRIYGSFSKEIELSDEQYKELKDRIDCALEDKDCAEDYNRDSQAFLEDTIDVFVDENTRDLLDDALADMTIDDLYLEGCEDFYEVEDEIDDALTEAGFDC